MHICDHLDLKRKSTIKGFRDQQTNIRQMDGTLVLFRHHHTCLKLTKSAVVSLVLELKQSVKIFKVLHGCIYNDRPADRETASQT